jgi:hypothetical protein
MLTIHPGRVGAGRKFLIFQDLFRTDYDLSFESKPGCAGEKKNDDFERGLLKFGDVACASPESDSAVIILEPQAVAEAIIHKCTESGFDENLTVVGHGFGCLTAKWFANLAPPGWVRDVALLGNVLGNPALVAQLNLVPRPSIDELDAATGEWLQSKTKVLCVDNPHFDVLTRHVISKYLDSLEITDPPVFAETIVNDVPTEWDYLRQVPIFRSNPKRAISLITRIPRTFWQTYGLAILCAIIVIVIFVVITALSVGLTKKTTPSPQALPSPV